MRAVICLCLLAVFTFTGCGGSKIDTPEKKIEAPDKDPSEKTKADLPQDKRNQ